MRPSTPVLASVLFATACSGGTAATSTGSTPTSDPGQQTSEPTPAAEEPTSGAEEAAAASSRAAPQSARTWTELRDALEPVEPSPTRAPRAASSECPPPANASEEAMADFYEQCVLPPMAVRERDAWLVLRTDRSEGGIERVFVLRARAGAEDETVVSGELSAEVLGRVRTSMARARTSAPSIVTAAASEEFSLSVYPVLAQLGAPLEGSLLFLETTIDLTHPEHVLRLLRADGTEIELARGAASLVPCDGDGWSCHEGADEDCTPEDLRAEERLCVEPWSIDSVHVAGRELLVIGTVIVAGDGGYPSFHWAAQLPE